jgi:arginyl-tRNA synthetase
MVEQIKQQVAAAVAHLYGEMPDSSKIQVTPTSSEFVGDYTVVVFPFVKAARKSPDAVGAEIGTLVQQALPAISAFNVIKGFLNLALGADYWHQFLGEVLGQGEHYGRQPRLNRKMMVEYSSPNTNKPLHLGHVRNCMLGWSCSRIFDAVGYDVVRVQIVNDRGVAICKSMVGWQKFGASATPESTGIKSDHFVGDYYVLFEQKTREEYINWQQTEAALAIFDKRTKTELDEGAFFKEYKNKWFNEHSALGTEVREMLLRWENGDEEVLALWRKMNNWVYAGFDTTYARMGVEFDKLYFESDTYLLGKDIVDDGLRSGVFFKKEDGSVWVDLTDAGHDQKVVLRADGTSMYITQDLGTARMRYHDFGAERVIYTVADEQNYHFQVLFETLKRLGEPYAQGLYHLSYGMVELPTGRMKTREGTVVDADDLMDEVVRLATEVSQEREEFRALPAEEQAESARRVGMAALKFFMLRVNPRKRMIFNPEESLDLQGQTGPFIQYTYVRTHGLLQRASLDSTALAAANQYSEIQPSEQALLKAVAEYPGAVLQAAEEYDPSHIAMYCYNLAKAYNRFWHDVKILGAETPEARQFRLQLSRAVGQVLQSGMGLLGVEMPTRM